MMTSLGSGLSISEVILLSKFLNPALPNGITNDPYKKSLAGQVIAKNFSTVYNTGIINAHESTASGLALQTMG
jgi:hypothetical protein